MKQTRLLSFTLVAAACLAMTAGSATPQERAGFAKISIDLDGDGGADTTLTLSHCPSDVKTTCLLLESTVVASRSIRISDTPNVCKGNQGVRYGKPIGAPLQVIGNHVGDRFPELSVLYCKTQEGAAPPALAIVDLSAGTVVANVVAPANQTASFTAFAKAPSGKLVPFLAPTYGDSDATPSMYSDGLWGYMCIYSAGVRAASRCGRDFIEVGTIPDRHFSREVSAYLQDLDGDGWEDINLIFHKRIYAVSSRTGQVLSNLEYDVAATTEPRSPKWFHSGRNYGTHSPVFNSRSGMLETVQVGGVAVGSFADANANVSRFVAVLDSVPREPQTRRMKWARYFGFASTTFAVIDAALAGDPPVLRHADFVNGAIHRFSDSRAVLDGRDVIILNYFRQNAITDGCLQVQYQVYLPPAYAKPKYDRWLECLARSLKNPGAWAVQVLDQGNGAVVLDTQNIYVWGKVESLLADRNIVYITEDLPGVMPYDLSDRPPGTLRVRSLGAKGWQDLGAFPVSGRPKITMMEAHGSAVSNANSPLAELTLRDIDRDGLPELQLLDEKWIGYDAATRKLVVKVSK